MLKNNKELAYVSVKFFIAIPSQLMKIRIDTVNLKKAWFILLWPQIMHWQQHGCKKISLLLKSNTYLNFRIAIGSAKEILFYYPTEPG